MKTKKIKIIALVLVTLLFSLVLSACVESCLPFLRNNHSFGPLTSLNIRHTGQLFQVRGQTTPVTFMATANLDADPQLNYNWFVNGTAQSGSNRSSPRTFVLNPQSQAGYYSIFAQNTHSSAINASQTVRVFNPYVMPFLRNKNGNFDTNDNTLLPANIADLNPNIQTNHKIDFFIDQILCLDTNQSALNQLNPSFLVEWFVDGNLSTSGLATTDRCDILSFSIERNYAKRASVSARLNQKAVLFKTECDQIFDFADIAIPNPTTVKNLQYCFNFFPNLKLSWDNNHNSLFEITVTSHTLNREFTVHTNANNGGINLTLGESINQINLLHNNTITVKALCPILNLSIDRFDTKFKAGGATQVSLPQKSLAALSFIQSTYLLGSHYMQSNQDIYDLFDYMIVFRPNAQRVNSPRGSVMRSNVKFFLGFNSTHTIQSLLRTFENNLAFTGRYWWEMSSTSQNGQLVAGTQVEISFEFLDQLEPNNFGRYTNMSNRTTSTPLRAPATSQNGWVGTLPVNNFPLSHSPVRTSDQLFFAVTNGFYPALTRGSAAERIFEKSKDILTQIIDNDMSQAQKAAAIYDWIMHNTAYDYYILSVSETSEAVKHPAFYLEGVFDLGVAVCDGIAKAFALMCAMANINATRVIGPARADRNTEFGQHAWNKVQIDGAWYMVDATWGIQSVHGGRYRLMSYAWFLLSDADTAGNRIEQGQQQPQTNTQQFNWLYQNGLFLHHSDNFESDLRQMVTQFGIGAQGWVNSGRSGNYFVAEFGISESLMTVLNQHNNLLRSQLDALVKSNQNTLSEFRIFLSYNTVTVALR
ncbi:MAG: hypothetical protein FWD86_01675 [Firmicutes bacterium]|nr:hypothetical protein [Bacillota bacterium]